jgi:hypothetical protein
MSMSNTLQGLSSDKVQLLFGIIKKLSARYDQAAPHKDIAKNLFRSSHQILRMNSSFTLRRSLLRDHAAGR